MISSVALVLDQHFGSAVEALAQQMPVWIIASRENDLAVGRARVFIEDQGRITSLFSLPRESEAGMLWRGLCDIDEHHGTESSPVSYDQVVVYGSSPNLVSPQIMLELGFEVITDHLPGMYCLRRYATAE